MVIGEAVQVAREDQRQSRLVRHLDRNLRALLLADPADPEKVVATTAAGRRKFPQTNAIGHGAEHVRDFTKTLQLCLGNAIKEEVERRAVESSGRIEPSWKVQRCQD